MALSSKQFFSFFDQNFFNSQDTFIHPTAVIGERVKLGAGVKVGPYCTIVGDVKIGDGTRIYAHASVGFPAQAHGVKESLGYIEIGKNCEIREFSSIGASRYVDGKTIIGDNCYIMNYCHVGHDAVLENNVTLINSVNLGGHTYIEHGAILMANSATHQFCRIGKFVALAPYSAIRQDLPPYGLYSGQPAQFAGLNLVGLKRAGFSGDSINRIKHVAKLFYQDKLMMNDIQKQLDIDQEFLDDNVKTFINFINLSSRGVSRKTLKYSSSVSSQQDI